MKNNNFMDFNYSLEKEWKIENQNGAYAMSSISGCNTTKKHGLFVSPLDKNDDDVYVFISSLEEEITLGDNTYNFSFQRYVNEFYSEGLQYLKEISFAPIPTFTYCVGQLEVKKQILICKQENRIFVNYTICDSCAETKIKINPLLACRNRFSINRRNDKALTNIKNVNNGFSIQLYRDVPRLFMQISRGDGFYKMPDWYYNIEYIKDKTKKSDYIEDLFSAGHFVATLIPGESLLFTAGFSELEKSDLNHRFSKELCSKN